MVNIVLACLLAGTRRALAAEVAGRHEHARRLFEQILTEMEHLEQQQAAPNSSRFPLLGDTGLPSKYEEGLIFAERLQCLQLLGQWQVIQDQVRGNAAAGTYEGLMIGQPSEAMQPSR